jgi:hypothetical protein
MVRLTFLTTKALTKIGTVKTELENQLAAQASTIGAQIIANASSDVFVKESLEAAIATQSANLVAVADANYRRLSTQMVNNDVDVRSYVDAKEAEIVGSINGVDTRLYTEVSGLTALINATAASTIDQSTNALINSIAAVETNMASAASVAQTYADSAAAVVAANASNALAAEKAALIAINASTNTALTALSTRVTADEANIDTLASQANTTAAVVADIQAQLS